MTSDEPSAAEALAGMQRAEQRSGELYAYVVAAPYLFVVGLTWLAADLLYALAPAAREWAWPGAASLGAVANIAVAIGQSRSRARGAQAAGGDTGQPLDASFWRAMTLWLILAGFVSATLFVFAPFSGVQVHSIVGLAFGSACSAAGLWLGKRILATGLGIAALTIIGHAFLRDVYTLYMGVVGGGGIMLAAWWLRKV